MQKIESGFAQVEVLIYVISYNFVRGHLSLVWHLAVAYLCFVSCPWVVFCLAYCGIRQGVGLFGLF